MANAIEELLKIVGPLAEAQGKISQKQMYSMRGYEDFYREHITGVENIYNNEQLLNERDSVVQYYNDNKNVMDEVNNDRFLRLIRKYDLQKESNDAYNVGLQRADDFSNQLYSGDINNPGILDRYNNVNTQTEFTKKQYVNVGGGAHEWKDAPYKPETDKELQELRDEERRKLIDEYSRLHQDYVQWHGEFSSSQSNRLMNAANRGTAFKLANLNEAYIFAVEQAEEDGIFDEVEASAYRKAAATGSMQPIDNYVAKESNFNRLIINRESSQMEALYDKGSINQDYLNLRNQWNTMSPDEQAEKGTQEAFKYIDGETEMSAAWEDLGDPSSHAFQWLDKIYNDNEEIKSQLRQKDVILSRTLGQSYLQAINKSENKTWNSAFIPFGATPAMPKVIPLEGGPDEQLLSQAYEKVPGYIKKRFDKLGMKKTPEKPLIGKFKAGKAIYQTKEEAKTPNLITKNDSQYFDDIRHAGETWWESASIKEGKVDEFFNLAINTNNFENGKLKEDTEIYRIIQRGIRGGNKRMKRLQKKLNLYGQLIREMNILESQNKKVPYHLSDATIKASESIRNTLIKK